MYNKWFYISKPVWNNSFSYEKRSIKKIYVPSLKKIDSIDEVELQSNKNKLAFSDYSNSKNLKLCFGLKNFYEIIWNWKKIYIFDNHNHAFYFWYLARKNWIIGDDNILYHIDEHADTRDNNKNINNIDSKDLKKVFKFTNEELNVGDYIIPALKEWIIRKVIQIRNSSNLQDYLKTIDKYHNNQKILNLDLDFFQPDLDFIDYDLKKQVILDIAKKVDVITIASSPFFIDQKLALKVLKDIFSK